MYEKCKINDKKKYWENIIISPWAYFYCLYVYNRSEVRKYIIDSEWACWYCVDINDDPEVRKYITNTRWLKTYHSKMEIKQYKEKYNVDG